MKKSKLLTLICVFTALSLLLCSCASGDDSPTDISSTSPHDSDNTYNVTILQYDNDPSSSLMREAYIARMRTLGYDEAKMRFDIISAHGDSQSLSANAQFLKDSRNTLIVAIGTAAAKAVAETENTVPCVFIGADDPVANGLCTNPEIPDRNLTGTAFRSSGETLLSVMRVYTPNVTSIAVINFSDNAAAKNDAEAVSAILSENAYTVENIELESQEGIGDKITELCAGYDAFYFPNDSYSEKTVSAVIETAGANGKLVFASNESFIKAGAVMGAFSGGEALANDAALISDRIIQGEKVSDIPVRADSEISLYANAEALERFELETPTADNLVLV